LRLRFTISANVAKGYEIMWRCSDSTPASLASSYLAVAAWLAVPAVHRLAITLPNASTTESARSGGVEDGDTVRRRSTEYDLYYRNGQLQGTVNDSSTARESVSA